MSLIASVAALEILETAIGKKKKRKGSLALELVVGPKRARRLQRRARRGVATALVAAFLILIVFSLFAYVFGIADNAAYNIGNGYAPGSLNTGDYSIFTYIRTWSPVIALFAVFLLVVLLAQRRVETF